MGFCWAVVGSRQFHRVAGERFSTSSKVTIYGFGTVCVSVYAAPAHAKIRWRLCRLRAFTFHFLVFLLQNWNWAKVVFEKKENDSSSTIYACPRVYAIIQSHHQHIWLLPFDFIWPKCIRANVGMRKRETSPILFNCLRRHILIIYNYFRAHRLIIDSWNIVMALQTTTTICAYMIGPDR